MKADINIIFICTAHIQSVTGMRRFKTLWDSLGLNRLDHVIYT